MTWSCAKAGSARSSFSMRSICAGIRSASSKGTPTRSRYASHTNSVVTPSSGTTARYPAWSMIAGGSSVDSGAGNGFCSPYQNGSPRSGGSNRPTSVSSASSSVGPSAVSRSPSWRPRSRAIPEGSAISSGPCGASPRMRRCSSAPSRYSTVSESGSDDVPPARRTVPRPWRTSSSSGSVETPSLTAASACSKSYSGSPYVRNRTFFTVTEAVLNADERIASRAASA